MSPTDNSPASSGFLPQWLKERVDQYIFVGWLVKFAGSCKYQFQASLPFPERSMVCSNLQISPYFFSPARPNADDSPHTHTVYLQTLWAELRRGHLGVLFGHANHEAREQSFAEFYKTVSKCTAEIIRAINAPLLPLASQTIIQVKLGRLNITIPPSGAEFANHEQQETPVPALVASAHGTVLDLGPGSGNQLPRFDAAKITHIYGVEPNTAFTQMMTDRLRETKVGQDGKYTLIPCGLEDEQTLARFGVVDGSMDCVISMQVMVSFLICRGENERFEGCA